MKFSLHALTFALGLVGGNIINAVTVGNKQSKRLRKADDDLIKQREFYEVLLRWIDLHQDGYTAADYFRKKNYNTVAIYGMKELGIALLKELKGSEIVVKYGIDRDADKIYAETDIFRPDEELESVDVVVVTALHYYTDIALSLRCKYDFPIIALDDVLYEAFN